MKLPTAPGTVFRTPLGRLCELLPKPEHGPHSDGASLHFAYLRRDGRRSEWTGFAMLPRTAQRVLVLVRPAP